MSNRQLAAVAPVVPDIAREKVVQYLDAFGLSKELSENEKKQFIEIACEFKLNPFKREVFCIPYGQGDSRKLSIIVGYEVYVKRAERSGKLNGWRAWTEGTGEDLKAVVEIHRRDWDKPFVHEVYFGESAQRKKDGSLTTFWQKQPRFQLKKVAISQGFRMCFPDELGGIPYDPNELPEEMGPAEPPRDVAPPKGHSGRREAQGSSAAPSANRTGSAPASPAGQENGGSTTVAAQPAGRAATEDRQALVEQINRLLSVNASSFPAAHIRWVNGQLRQSPSLERLKEILAHLAGALSSPTETREPPAPAAPQASEGDDGKLLF